MAIQCVTDSDVLNVLSGASAVDIWAPLRDGVTKSAQLGEVRVLSAALTFDANVLLNVAKGRKAGVVDYLNARHAGPIIVSQQTAQEFWNNKFRSVVGTREKIESSFKEFARVVKEVDPVDPGISERLQQIVDDLTNSHGHLWSSEVAAAVESMIGVLSDPDKCVRCCLDRQRLAAIAVNRKRSATPPGFEDDGDGDFLLWADLLGGLGRAAADVRFADCDQVIIVTDDRKRDWSSKGIPHPLLRAEMFALHEAELFTVGLQQFEHLITAPSPGEGVLTVLN